jgi:hypothetical protein
MLFYMIEKHVENNTKMMSEFWFMRVIIEINNFINVYRYTKYI